MRSIPTTSAERMRRALPFAGTSIKAHFSATISLTVWLCFNTATWMRRRVVSTGDRCKTERCRRLLQPGHSRLQRHDFSQARQYLEQALKLRPNYPEAWNNLGMMAAQEGHADDAVQNFRQSLLLTSGLCHPRC